MTEDGLFRLGLWIFYVGFIKTNALSAIAVEAGVQPQEFFQIRLFHSFQLQEIFTGLQFLIQIQDREISEGRGQIVFFVTRFQIRLIESSAIILDCGACRSQKIKNSQRISGSHPLFPPSTDGETICYFPALPRQSNIKKWNIVIVRWFRYHKKQGRFISRKRRNSIIFNSLEVRKPL